MSKTTLKIDGMHCTSCALNINRELTKNSGVKDAKVNFAAEKAEIEFDESVIDINEIKKIISNSGYQVNENADSSLAIKKQEALAFEKQQRTRLTIATLLTLPVFIRMFWMWEINGHFLEIANTALVMFLLSGLVVFIFGWPFHKNAFKLLIKRQTNMDTLVSMGTLSAFLYSTWAMSHGITALYFDGAAGITSLILLGKFLELKTKNRASQAMEKLMELGVKKARIIFDGQEIEKNIDDVLKDEIISIKPGEKIPLDAEIINGETMIDESMLTGESLPVTKNIGSKIYAATINLNGTINARVLTPASESMLSQIIRTVEEAQNFKAPMQKLADRISSIFVPTVIALSVLTFLGWYSVTGDTAHALISAVTVLIISCPCALGLATPIAILVGTSVGAKNGILIKNGEAFEKAKNIDVVVFDKTGTLTIGKPRVEKIITNTNENFTEEKLIKIGASLANKSLHPISQAILFYGQEKNAQLADLENFQENSGQGVTASCRTHKTKLALGNLKLLETLNINIDWAKDLIDNNHNGKTIVFVAHDYKIAGAFLIADQIKENTKTAIADLNKINLQPMLLSGDNKMSAEIVAREIGITNVIAEVLPTEKLNEIKKLQAVQKKVVFVGDGINDAPSLVQADLGIAMGSGSDIAKETGDIIIIKNDPLKVVEAIKLSRKTFTIIKENLFWAFFYNTLAIPLAMTGLINPMIGALTMGFSDVTIIVNSLRIYRQPGGVNSRIDKA